MKRLLLAVFAAAVTAAWAVPSSAADFTFSGQYRLRGEYRNNSDFNDGETAGTTNDHTDSWGQRVRLTANAKATDDVSVKITLQDTRDWGTTTKVPVVDGSTTATGGPGLTDTGNTLDLHESYVNIAKVLDMPVDLRIGRQELAYGDERLIGSFGWSNNGRSFDAIKGTYTSETFNLDVFTSKIKENTTTNRDQDLWGAYATVKSIPNNTLDIYALRLSDHSTTNAMVTNNNPQLDATTPAQLLDGYNNLGAIGAQTLLTYGVRIKGATSGIDYTAELPFQKGTIKTASGDVDLKGSALAVKAGYTIPNTPKVRVGVEYDRASGDKDATDNKNETFSNLFPTNHDKLGYMDQQGWRNVKAWNLNASAEPSDKLKLLASYWNFKLAEKTDGWYGAGNWMNTPTGTLRLANPLEPNDSIGTEIDLVATYKYNSAVTAELGISRFSAGSYIKDRVDATTNGQSANQDWAYLQIITNF